MWTAKSSLRLYISLSLSRTSSRSLSMKDEKFSSRTDCLFALDVSSTFDWSCFTRLSLSTAILQRESAVFFNDKVNLTF